MLIYANQFHICCHIPFLSNDASEISLHLLLSCKQSGCARAENSGTRHFCCLMASVSGDFAKPSGKGLIAERFVPVLSPFPGQQMQWEKVFFPGPQDV